MTEEITLMGQILLIIPQMWNESTHLVRKTMQIRKSTTYAAVLFSDKRKRKYDKQLNINESLLKFRGIGNMLQIDGERKIVNVAS